MPDPTPTQIYLITNAGPDHDQTEAYSTEALARAAFAEELEIQADDACEGFDPGQPTPMLLRGEVLLSSEFVTFATAEDDSEDGARCRANGWDYLAKLTAFEPEPPPADPALLAAANRALVEEVERLRALLTSTCEVLDGGDTKPDELPGTLHEYLQTVVLGHQKERKNTDEARALACTLLLCARSEDVIPQDLPEWLEEVDCG